mgnify:FL=1
MTKNVLVTGGFDPIHSGHLAYLKSAKMLGDKLWVGINSDEWLQRKKGQFFMDTNERLQIVSNLKFVDYAFLFDDRDNSASNAISHVLKNIEPESKVIFANGGDRNEGNIPEMDNFSESSRVIFEFGVGGEDKKNSSSWILENWKNPSTKRKWGHYKVFDEREGVKVKELVIAPKSSLSDQKHFKRSEHWYILEGSCTIFLEKDGKKSEVVMNVHDSLIINQGTWHKAVNSSSSKCSVLEVQYGDACVEEDIERRE